MASSQQLIDYQIRNQVYLERLKAGEIKILEKAMIRQGQELRRILSSVDITDFSRARAEALINEVARILGDIHSPARKELITDMEQIGIYQAGFEVAALDAVSNGITFTIPSDTQVIQAVRLNPLSIKGASGGKLLDTFLEDFSASDINMMTGAIRQGFFEGKTTQQIIQSLIGTKANKYKDGLLDISRRNAETITRTSVQHAAMQGSMMAMMENEDVLKGYRWISTLDSRTSSVCRSLDGVVFRFGKGPVPPAHANCRSRITPELDDDLKWLDEGSTRSSKDGYVSADLSYYEWLKTQPQDFIVDALGKSRAALFTKGGIDAKEFARLNLGRNFEPLTLAEMRDKDPLAFIKAGI